METGRIVELEVFQREDFDRLIGWVGSKEELMQFAGFRFSFPLSHEQLQSYSEDNARRAYRVVHFPTKTVIGHAELDFSDPSVVKICRVLIGEKAWRGKGLGPLLVGELLKVAFSDRVVERVELNVFEWNSGAIRCYEKAGFEKMERVKEVAFKGNNWRLINMRVNRERWAKLRV